MTRTLHAHSLRMTLLLARQPGDRAFRRRGQSKPGAARTMGRPFPLPEERAGPPVLRAGLPPAGHHGRQRPQAGWRAEAAAAALAGAGAGAEPGALGSLAGAAGAAGGRWKW